MWSMLLDPWFLRGTEEILSEPIPWSSDLPVHNFQSIGATVMEYHRLGALNMEIYFLAVLEARKFLPVHFLVSAHGCLLAVSSPGFSFLYALSELSLPLLLRLPIPSGLRSHT